MNSTRFFAILTISNKIPFVVIALLLILGECSPKKSQEQFESELQALNLQRGEIALCGAGQGKFGTVLVSQSCAEKVREDFDLATALLHSFEYTEAEKVFAKVIDADPACVMAYWGVAMSNFHPLWSPPSPSDLEKGAKTIALARSLDKVSARELKYLDAIAAIYDQWDKVDYKTRLSNFERATENIYLAYPEDKEAAIFYALALRAAADPADRTFHKQKKAGTILKGLLQAEPNHPGITHYIIHTYDYPELADLALPAARQYASIAAASAHAQHMPSHIFTRLGLWNESIQSNIASVAAAQCYAQNMNIKGHWDEELHGLDYLMYSYLQQGNVDKAKEQFDYLQTITEMTPVNFKDVYSIAALPSRYFVENRLWKDASQLSLNANIPWEKFLWEQSNIHFAMALGSVHTGDIKKAEDALSQLQGLNTKLNDQKESYTANQVLVQMKVVEGWIQLYKGNRGRAISALTEAANLEDATEKHPVTPGEIIPARELLGDLYLVVGNAEKALEAYEADLKRHPNRFNGLFGAAVAADKFGRKRVAVGYFKQFLELVQPGPNQRPEVAVAESYLKTNAAISQKAN